MGKKKTETVCLDDGQMKNIINAARADESGDKKRQKKACPKALDFVQKYAPRKENEKPSKAEKFIESLALKKTKSWLRKKIPDTSGWF